MHLILSGTSLAGFMTQSARGDLKMDDVLLEYCYWCVNNREILNVINHEGTPVSLYRKHYDMQQSRSVDVCVFGSFC